MNSSFLIDCPNYKKQRDSTIKSFQDTEHFDISQENITKKLRELFSNFDSYKYQVNSFRLSEEKTPRPNLILC